MENLEEGVFDPRERAEEKRRSREADEQALASGAKTPEDLRRENSRLAFPAVHIDFSRSKLS